MEPTTKLNEVADNPRSRRALLAGVVGGLGAWLVSAAQRAMPAEAAAGDTVLAGRSNSGGGFSTELRANTTKPTFRAVQLGGGNALRGEATSGRAVMGTAGHDGTGLWGYSPDHYGLHARTDSGTAVYAEGFSNGAIAIDCFAFGPGTHALKARGHSELGDVTLTIPDFPTEGTPVAPPAGSVTLFPELDLVSGKMRLKIRFPTGPVQVLATEA